MEQCPKISGALHFFRTERFLKLLQPKIQNPNYRPQRSWSKVIFLHVSVILFTGGSVPLHAGIHPPGTRGRHPPREQTLPLHEWTPPVQCMLGDTGSKWAVRFLLECRLVCYFFLSSCVIISDYTKFSSDDIKVLCRCRQMWKVLNSRNSGI